MKTDVIKTLGRIFILLPLAIMAGATYFVLTGGIETKPGDLEFFVVLLIFSGVYFPLAWLIISRDPNNIFGWFFIAAVSSFTPQTTWLFLVQGLGIKITDSPLIENLVGGVFVFGLLIPITFMLLYFPDGRLISRRWRVVSFAAVLGMVALYAGFIFEDLQDELNFAWVQSVGKIMSVLSFFILFGLLGSLASVISRYRSSKGVPRAQIKWVVFMSAVGISILLLGLITDLLPPAFGVLIVFSPPILIALAIGLAILRYRLFDIDIIIRRTLSYSILTAVLGLIYFGGIVLLQNVFGGLFDRADSPLITVIFTLAIAALFNPLRSRIQDVIDRRYFRSKYDAEKALAEFAVITRDEVDVVLLSGSLLSVVEDTMHPKEISLWLRESA